MSRYDAEIRYALWTLAVVCFGLGATNTGVLGLDQGSLLLVATVFAAVTVEYRGGESGSCS